MQFFSNVSNIDELKQQYRKLCKMYHPDICKSPSANEIMAKINAEYEKLFNQLKTNRPNENKNHSFNDGFRDVINKIINLNIEIEVCGSWIWLSGNTYPYKEKLKKIGFQWSKNKKRWYWMPAEQNMGKRKGFYTMEKIRERYGSIKIQTNPENELLLT